MTTLSNKIVFITGASAGIGEACAKEYAKHGANLIITARRKDRLESLSQELRNEYNVKVLPLTLDVCDKNAVNKCINDLPSEFHSIDILINNAGVMLTTEKFQDIDCDLFDKMIDTNVKGLLYVTKAILPLMLNNNRGHIVNVGSVAANITVAGANVYASTKHALKSISEILRIDLLGTPIRVSQVDPGPVHTELATVRWDKERADKFYSQFQALHALDVAESIVFCTSRKSHVNIDSLCINSIDAAGPYLNNGKRQTIFD